MDHTYVDDVVDRIIAALDHTEHPFDTYNLATGMAPSVREMIAILREIVPGVRISARDGEINHSGGFDMPRKGAVDGSRAMQVFGYRPRFDIRAGLHAYVDSAKARSTRASEYCAWRDDERYRSRGG